MTEKKMRERLAAARPAEVPIVCMYLVAAVFEGSPPSSGLVLGVPGLSELFNLAGVINRASITVTSYQAPVKRKARRKKLHG